MYTNEICEKVLYSKEEIASAIEKTGKKIKEDYNGKDILFIAVLNGSFMFLSDLIRSVESESLIDFIKVSTYGNNTLSSGNFTIKQDLSMDITGKNIIIVEDILDTGFTMSNLLKYVDTKKPASVKIATLIDKPARRINEVKADYVCFTMDDDAFIVGYGLDYAQKYRNLPCIGVLKESLIDK